MGIELSPQQRGQLAKKPLVRDPRAEGGLGAVVERKRRKVGRNTISRYEIGHDILASALDSLEKALVDQDVVFFEGDRVYGTGVGIKKRQSSKR